MSQQPLTPERPCKYCGGKGYIERHQPGHTHYETDDECPSFHFERVPCTCTTIAELRTEIDRLRSQPCPDDFKHKIFAHKYLDPECVESGCRSLQPCQPPGCPELLREAIGACRLLKQTWHDYVHPSGATVTLQGLDRLTKELEFVAELAPISGEPQLEPTIIDTMPPIDKPVITRLLVPNQQGEPQLSDTERRLCYLLDQLSPSMFADHGIEALRQIAKAMREGRCNRQAASAYEAIDHAMKKCDKSA